MLHLNTAQLSITPVLSAIGGSSGPSHTLKTEHQCMQPNNAKKLKHLVYFRCLESTVQFFLSMLKIVLFATY